jgi:hypothetical protein
MPITKGRAVGKCDALGVQVVFAKDPVRQHVLIVELRDRRIGTADETTIAIADVGDRALNAEIYDAVRLIDCRTVRCCFDIYSIVLGRIRDASST